MPSDFPRHHRSTPDRAEMAAATARRSGVAGGECGTVPVHVDDQGAVLPGAITHLIAGVPVSDLGAGIDWYTRFFGRPPDLCAGEEILWDIDEHATLFIEPDTARAGAGRITFIVTGLDALLQRLAAHGIEHEPIETYSDGARHVTIPDPDGNAIAFVESPRS